MIRLKKKNALFFISISTLLFFAGLTLTYTNAMANESFLQNAWGAAGDQCYPCTSLGLCGGAGGGMGSCKLYYIPGSGFFCSGNCTSSCASGVNQEYCRGDGGSGCTSGSANVCSKIYDYDCSIKSNPGGNPSVWCECDNPTDTGNKCPLQVCY